jgi:hypothetical protein
MLSDPLVLKDNAAADVTYDLLPAGRTSNDPNSAETNRVDRASSASEPRKLTIKQSITGKGKARVRRTLLQIQETKLDALGTPVLQTNNLSWTFQLDGTYSSADLYDNLCQLVDMVANVSAGALVVDSTKLGPLLQGQA